VIFALGDDLFAADVRLVERVLRAREPVVVPHMPRWVAGVVEHAGRSLPLVDLRRRFELPDAPAGLERRVLVAGSGADAVGLVVDRVIEVAPVAGTLDDAPPLFRGLAREYLQGILRREGGLVIVLDLARLLTATERIALQQAMVDV
jgi:purine-binding chemotaxis protein CheW